MMSLSRKNFSDLESALLILMNRKAEIEKREGTRRGTWVLFLKKSYKLQESITQLTVS